MTLAQLLAQDVQLCPGCDLPVLGPDEDDAVVCTYFERTDTPLVCEGCHPVVCRSRHCL